MEGMQTTSSDVSEHGFPRAALVPLTLSLGGLACGVASIVASASGEFAFAAILVVTAVFFDGLDGTAARALRVEGPFGETLDSLCDVIGFVLAPAFLAYQAGLYSYEVVGPASMFAFVACGVIRLARFPLMKTQKYFLGLPTPAGGATLAMLSLYANELPSGLLVVATAGLAVLMVTLIRFPKFNSALRILPPPLRWAFAVVLVPALLMIEPRALLGLMCLYLLSGPAIELRLQRAGPVFSRG
jgi:CDP-diacylglycerol--serine O-phosphatidyltransferase